MLSEMGTRFPFHQAYGFCKYHAVCIELTKILTLRCLVKWSLSLGSTLDKLTIKVVLTFNGKIETTDQSLLLLRYMGTYPCYSPFLLGEQVSG